MRGLSEIPANYRGFVLKKIERQEKVPIRGPTESGSNRPQARDNEDDRLTSFYRKEFMQTE